MKQEKTSAQTILLQPIVQELLGHESHFLELRNFFIEFPSDTQSRERIGETNSLKYFEYIYDSRLQELSVKDADLKELDFSKAPDDNIKELIQD